MTDTQAAPARAGSTAWTRLLMNGGIIFLAGYIVTAFMPGIMTLGDYAALRASDFAGINWLKGPCVLLCIACVAMVYRRANERQRRTLDIVAGLSYFVAAMDWFCLDVRLMQALGPLFEQSASAGNPSFVDLRIRLLTLTPSPLTFLLLGASACFFLRIAWAWVPLLTFLVLTGHIALLPVAPGPERETPPPAAQAAPPAPAEGAAPADGETAPAAPDAKTEAINHKTAAPVGGGAFTGFWDRFFRRDSGEGTRDVAHFSPDAQAARAGGGALSSFWELLFHDAALFYAFFRWREKRPKKMLVPVAAPEVSETPAQAPVPEKKEAPAPLDPEAAAKAKARAEKIAAAKKARAGRKGPPKEDSAAAPEEPLDPEAAKKAAARAEKIAAAKKARAARKLKPPQAESQPQETAGGEAAEQTPGEARPTQQDEPEDKQEDQQDPSETS